MRAARAGAVAGVVALVCAAPAAGKEKLERYSVELTEFAGSSQIFTAHALHPSCAGTEAVNDGTLQGSFSSPLSGVRGVRIGKSDARGKLSADAGLASYSQAGQRFGDRAPCHPEGETQPFEASCARSVPTVPGVIGRLVDASRKRVEVHWQPTFDGVEGRFTPDFFCIESMGAIPMRTTPLTRADTCEERQYPRRYFERDSGVFELEVVCATDFVPFEAPGGMGTYGGSYRAQLTLEAVEEKD